MNCGIPDPQNSGCSFGNASQLQIVSASGRLHPNRPNRIIRETPNSILLLKKLRDGPRARTYRFHSGCNVRGMGDSYLGAAGGEIRGSWCLLCVFIGFDLIPRFLQPVFVEFLSPRAAG